MFNLKKSPLNLTDTNLFRCHTAGKTSGNHPRFSSAGKAIVTALLTSSLLLGGAVPTYADAIWDRWQAADRAVQAGEPAAAVPHWEFLANYYASTGDWESAALFCGKLDQYFDGIHDYEQAIKYYELENEYWVKAGKDWGAVDIQRADQIRTIIEAYITTADAEALKARALPKQGKLSKFEPEYGMYIGLYPERDPQMLNYYSRSEQFYGKKHALYLVYTQVGKPFPKQYVDRAKQVGAGLQIAWEPINGLDAVTEDVVRAWAKEAKAAGIPIFLRYASEMNGNWVPWHGDTQKYIQNFRMVHDIMEQEAPNVAMVWSPGEVPKSSIESYYPGDDYVDWVGVSLYSEPYENGDPQQGNMQGTSPVERLDHLYKTYSDRKPLMISETAVSHYANLPQESFTEYGTLNLQRLYGIMPYKYPRLKAITYFNVNLEMKESKNNYLLRDNEAMMSLYKNLIAPSYFLTKIGNNAKPAQSEGLVPLTAGMTFAKQARITPFVKIPDTYIGKMEYYINGQLVQTQTSPPYGLDLKAGDVPDGSVLELAVYNHSGVKAASKAFPISSAISVTVDGKELSFEQPPVIREGTTLAPVRAIFEAVGASVEWDAATQTAIGKKGDTTVKIAIGSQTVFKNGQPVTLEASARLIQGSTMVPARFVGEAFGGRVSWEGSSRTVVIQTDGQKNAAVLPTLTGSTKLVTQTSEETAADKPLSLSFKNWVKLQLERVSRLWDRIV